MILENAEVLVKRLGDQLAPAVAKHGADALVMLGIHTGGVWIAECLHARFALRLPLGTLNINFYRDDFSRIGLHPRIEPSEIAVSVDDRHVVLVDDVLYTGRTVRAAMNEIFDYGRPSSIKVAILVDRKGRELPICPDFCATTVDLPAEHNVELRGPDPLSVVVI